MVLLGHLGVFERRAVALSLRDGRHEALNQLSQNGFDFPMMNSGFTVTRDSFDLAWLFLIVVATS